MNRPGHEMVYGFEEWCAWKAQKPEAGVAKNAPQPLPEAAAATRRPRHTTGTMNRLEAKYAAHLGLRKTAGEIVDWRFEPMKLRLARATFLDVDFLVVTGAVRSEVELHEVKGHWEDDARVKIKVAAKEFAWWRFVGVQWDKTAKDWKYEEFRA
jgi:hypothetical protein